MPDPQPRSALHRRIAEGNANSEKILKAVQQVLKAVTKRRTKPVGSTVKPRTPKKAAKPKPKKQRGGQVRPRHKAGSSKPRPRTKKSKATEASTDAVQSSE